MSEQNKQVVLQYVEAFNNGDLEGLCRLFTPNALVYGVLGWGGMEQVRPIWKDLMESFRMSLQVESMISEGDIVAVRYIERGTSTQPFRGGPSATGMSYEIVAMEWFEMKDGLIHRRWGARDSASQHRQMGLPLG